MHGIELGNKGEGCAEDMRRAASARNLASVASPLANRAHVEISGRPP